MLKIASAPKLKKWQRSFYSITIIGTIVISSFLLGLCWNNHFFFSPSRTNNPEVVQEYLEDIGFNIELPEFTVERHTYKLVGGDDTEEWWEIEFAQQLSSLFITKLDSLCRVDSSRWVRLSRDNGPGKSRGVVPCYEFSYRNQESVEFRETITIFPSRKIAWLSHYKM